MCEIKYSDGNFNVTVHGRDELAVFEDWFGRGKIHFLTSAITTLERVMSAKSLVLPYLQVAGDIIVHAYEGGYMLVIPAGALSAAGWVTIIRLFGLGQTSVVLEGERLNE